MEKIIINAENTVLGRLASYAAKKALLGNEVIILNAEKIIISGTKERVLANLKKKLKTRTLGNIKKGPTHPRRADTYVRRVIRGMLPWKQPKGKEAFKRIKTFIGIPEDYRDENIIIVKELDSLKLNCPTVSIVKLSKEIGG